jgi:uncharacterized membrane protein required for colicin V production
MTPELLFAAAAPATSQGWFAALKGGNLPFNWFDLLVLVVLAVGFTRGRKHGMSEEMMYLTQWLVIIFGAAWAYLPGGDYLASVTPSSKLTSYILAYIITAILLKSAFALLKRAVGGKLIGSNMFGAAEYYLGMAAGIGRFACILIFSLALLNAPFYSDALIAARTKYNTDLYGSNFFPTVQEIQTSVFSKSFLGPLVKKHLPGMLIKPTASEAVPLRRAGEWQWQ